MALRHDGKPIWIGVQGPTCAGKTEFAKGLCEMFGAHAVPVNLDRFYKPFDRIASNDPLAHNFDAPEALDWECLLAFIDSMATTGHGLAPSFDYVNGQRGPAEQLSGCDVVIIEGLWPFFDQRILRYMSMKVFIDADADVRLIRRLRRDVLNGSRGWSSVESALLYYEHCARPMERLFIKPGREIADVIIDGENSLGGNLEKVSKALHARKLLPI